jgi:nucleotide-binding universal stress UspA family protein
MKAVVGIDGSPESYAAARLAGRLLSPNRDEVILFYSPGKIRQSGGARDLSREALLAKLTTAVFDRARQQLPVGFRNAKTVVSQRDPREGLQLAVRDRRCSLLVVGAKGTGPLQSARLGGVARHLADHATVPLLIVRGRILADRPRVLLACDGTQTSLCASTLPGGFTWTADAIGYAITVIEPKKLHQTPEWIRDEFDEEQLATLGTGKFLADPNEILKRRKEAAKWYGQLPAIFADRAPLIVSGHVGDEILAAIKAFDINLTVVGARCRSPIRRLLLGSTSDYVVNHAPCSVLIVRGTTRAHPLRIYSPSTTAASPL